MGENVADSGTETLGDDNEIPKDSQDSKNEDDLISESEDTEALEKPEEKPEDSQDLEKEDDLISTTENVDNDIVNTDSDEKVVSDNQDTTESNDEVKVGIFITDIEEDENETSLPEEASEETGADAVIGTEVDRPESNVSTSDKEENKEDSLQGTDEEVGRQDKDHQNENSIQIEGEKK